MKNCILICIIALSFSQPLPGQAQTSVENQETLNDLHSELKLSLQANQRALEEERTKRRQTAQISFFTFLILGLGIVFFRNQRVTAEQKRCIAEYDRNVFKTELECKECELANMSTYVIQKNELLDSLKKDVDYFSNLLNSK